MKQAIIIMSPVVLALILTVGFSTGNWKLAFEGMGVSLLSTFLIVAWVHFVLDRFN